MKKLESLRKKELIELITTIRPKADAYDRVCKELGIKNNILGFVKNLTIPRVSNPVVCKIGQRPDCCYYRDITNDCKGCRENANNCC